MQAIVIHAPKDLRIDSAEVHEPGPGEALVNVRMGGICGSDLHYFRDGGFGDIRIREPMVLGHEVSGVVEAVGPGGNRALAGARVAINPSRPCGQCRYCLEGVPNHCLDMRFFGSAMRFPHVQGAFQQRIVVSEAQCVPTGDDIGLDAAAFAEPLSVALHAVNRAGALLGKRVLITGCGPIGAALVAAVRYHGAREIIVADILDAPLECARALGADRTVNVSSDPDALAVPHGEKGLVDVVIEASGSQAAVRSALDLLKPRGILVQLGVGGDIELPQNIVVAKEIEMRGSFRFHDEFALAVEFIASGRIDVAPIITHRFAIADALEAFKAAADPGATMKVQIDFS